MFWRFRSYFPCIYLTPDRFRRAFRILVTTLIVLTVVLIEIPSPSISKSWQSGGNGEVKNRVYGKRQT